MTACRKTLLEYLESHCDEQLAIEDMQRELAASGISRSALYRNVDRLVSEGVLRRVSNGSRRTAYQYIGEHCCEHIHVQCTVCGRISHIEEAKERALKAALAGADFKIDEQKTVLYGVCRECG